MENTHFKAQIFSTFWLKIFALLFMTIDHVGLLFIPTDNIWYEIFRSIGRLTVPLIAFMLAEGVIHTRNIWKYLLRIGIVGTLITGGLIFIVESKQLPEFESFATNVFLDLFLGCLGGYFLNHKNWKLKFIAILPILYAIGSFIVEVFEGETGAIVHWFPYFLRTQYGFYIVLLTYGFVFAYKLKDWFFKLYAQNAGIDEETFKDTPYERLAANLISALLLIVITLIFYLCHLYLKFGYLDSQNFAMVAGAFILLYNGKVGYNKKWFKYSAYAYYIVHILILAGIYFLTTI